MSMLLPTTVLPSQWRNPEGKTERMLLVTFSSAQSGVTALGSHFDLDVTDAMRRHGFQDIALAVGCTPILLNPDEYIETGVTTDAGGTIIQRHKQMKNKGIVIQCNRTTVSAYYKHLFETVHPLVMSGNIHIWVDAIDNGNPPFNTLRIALRDSPVNSFSTNRYLA